MPEESSAANAVMGSGFEARALAALWQANAEAIGRGSHWNFTQETIPVYTGATRDSETKIQAAAEPQDQDKPTRRKQLWQAIEG
jgi:hypothetical protein